MLSLATEGIRCEAICELQALKHSTPFGALLLPPPSAHLELMAAAASSRGFVAGAASGDVPAYDVQCMMVCRGLAV